jgi:hypothetical protein
MIENHLSRPTLYVDNLGQGNYRVLVPGDIDGDGVKDGEALNSPEAKVVNATGLNQIFAQNGITQINAEGAALSSIGGAAVTAANADASTNFSMAPLPDFSGYDLGSPPPDSIGPKVDWLTDVKDAALMWVAMRTMAELAQRDITDQRELRDEMHKSKNLAEKASIAAQRRQIESQRSAALFSLIGNIATTAATFMISQSGGGENESIARAFAEFGRGFINYVNKAHGPERQADEEKLLEMRHRMMMTMYEQVEDDAKSAIDSAREEFKLALRIIQEHEERNSQIISRATS